MRIKKWLQRAAAGLLAAAALLLSPFSMAMPVHAAEDKPQLVIKTGRETGESGGGITSGPGRESPLPILFYLAGGSVVLIPLVFLAVSHPIQNETKEGENRNEK